MNFRRPCLLWLLLLLFHAGMAQPSSRKADSLRQLISVTKSDTARGNLLVMLSDVLRPTDSAGAFRAAAEALRLQTAQRFTIGIAKARFNFGRVYYAYSQLDSSEAQYKAGLATVAGDTSLAAVAIRAKLTGNLGGIYGQRGMAEKELEMILSVIPMLEQARDTLSLAVANFNVGAKFYNGEQFTKAYGYLLKGIAFHRHRPSPQLTDALIAAAWCASDLDSLDAMRRHLDEARQHLDTTDHSMLAQFDIAQGLYFFRTKQYAAAEKSYLHALKASPDPFPLNTANALDALHDLYAAQGRYQSAKKIMEQYLALSRRINWANNILHGLQRLSGLEEKMNNPAAALQYLREYVQLNDSLKKEESDVRLHSLEMKYRATEQEKKILVLENESKQQQLNLQRNRAYIFLLLAGLLVAVLAALLIFIVYRNRHRSARQKEQLHYREMENIRQAQRLDNFSAMLEGQEMERKRLARDLHDGLGGTMASIRLKTADIADEAARGGDAKALHRIVAELDGASQELRRIAHNMMPETLLRFGLEAALKDLCAAIPQNGINIVFQGFGIQPDLPQPHQIMIYRLVQELVNNAVRHAGARNILVQCLQRDHELSVTVEDDGKGFDTNAPIPENSMGLQNIQARVDYLKGKLDIQSTPGTGTTVNIEIDVQQTTPGIATDH
ncbi:hypothetical protein EGT74_11645 [Chitinophaga lutea]|uniref:histidine kinase n=1 Tax=Chitinophaga lutea TaxID=2488634 RepID=A0A3N4Q220_9BACT|nr:ATP-binding protein [Chitinophaga lutea]RPE14126.1 hypothetical protein EGT74_11645 [Chitinophaga lutea]